MKKPEKEKIKSRVDDEKSSPPARKPVTVLHVDDDPNDTTLLQVACARADVGFELQNMVDGTEVMDYLTGIGKYADRNQYRFPGLVLLDLKMPRATGLEVLKWIRSHAMSKHLPVIVLSGSELQEDMNLAFAGGANSYLVKPPNLSSLISMVKDIGARLPALPHP